MERIAVFAGSFDPFTVAHLAIVKRASAIFDRVIVVVGKNVQKNSLLSVETRMRFVQKATANLKKLRKQDATEKLFSAIQRLKTAKHIPIA